MEQSILLLKSFFNDYTSTLTNGLADYGVYVKYAKRIQEIAILYYNFYE
jgi:hypothetical protein